MAKLSQIQTDSNWGAEAPRINENFNAVNSELEALRMTTSVNIPLFASVADAQKAIPVPYEGKLILVGTTLPAAVYKWDGTKWYNTGITGGETNVSLEDYYTKAENDTKFSELESKIVKKTTELNISNLYPTQGIGGTNKYDLATAIAQVPAEYRNIQGLKITFINDATGKTETWKYEGGTFTSTSNWLQGDGASGNKILTWETDAATTRKQVPLQERKSLLLVSYKDANENPINEQYVGTVFTDTEWAKDSNWLKIAKSEDVDGVLDYSKKYEFVGCVSFGSSFVNATPSLDYFYKTVKGYNIKAVRVNAEKYPVGYDLYLKNDNGETFEHIVQPDDGYVFVDIPTEGNTSFSIRNITQKISFTQYGSAGWAYEIQMLLANNDSIKDFWLGTLTEFNYDKKITLDKFKNDYNIGDAEFTSGSDIVNPENIYNKDNRVFPIPVKDSGYITEITLPYAVAAGIDIKVFISDRFSLLKDINEGTEGRIISFKSSNSDKQICNIFVRGGEYIGVSYKSKGKYLQNKEVSVGNNLGFHIMYSALIRPTLSMMEKLLNENPLTEDNYADIINLDATKFTEIYGTKDMGAGSLISANTINSGTRYSPYSAPRDGFVKSIKVGTPFSKDVDITIYVSNIGGKLASGTVVDMSKVAETHFVNGKIATQEIACDFKIKKGQVIALVFNDKNNYGTEGGSSIDGWYIYHQVEIVDVLTKIESSESEGNTQSAINSLKPCSVYTDDFSTEKSIDYVDIDETPYTIKQKRAWTFENCSVNRENVLNAYVDMNTSGAKALLNNVYTADNRTMSWLIEVADVNSAINIGSEINYGSIEGQTKCLIDFSAKTIDDNPFSIDIVQGNYYYINFIYTSFDVSVVIIDASDSSKTEKISLGYAELKGYPVIELVRGAIKVHKLSISILGAGASLYITGDSILMCKAVPNLLDRWGYKLRHEIGDVVISGRGTSLYKEVLYRVCSEINFLKPHCIIDQNFVNGFSTAYIDFMINWCKENNIRYIHTMPMPGRYSDSANGRYIIQNCDTIRFDLATSIGGKLENGDDETMLISDKLHLSTKGSLAAYDRVKMDYPNW